MKKFVAAMLAVMTLVVSCVSLASAGSLFDWIGDAIDYCEEGVSIIYHATVDTAEYVFTDKSADECYSDTLDAVNSTVDSAKNLWDTTKRVASDAGEATLGCCELVGGVVCGAGTAVYEAGQYVVTGGDSDFSTTEQFFDVAKDGYEKADNGVLMDVALLANPVAASVVNAGKTVVEYGVGYKDGEDVKDSMVTMVTNVMSVGAGDVIATAVPAANEEAAHFFSEKAGSVLSSLIPGLCD